MNATEARFERCIEEEADTIELAQRLAPLLLPADLIILSGDLGAGKTFLTRALCRALGLPKDERVTSPTFTLVHEYLTKPPILHADLYRLTDEEEVYELGLESRRGDGSLLIVEWGAPFETALGGSALHVDIDLEPRTARFRGASARARTTIEQLAITYREGGSA